MLLESLSAICVQACLHIQLLRQNHRSFPGHSPQSTPRKNPQSELISPGPQTILQSTVMRLQRRENLSTRALHPSSRPQSSPMAARSLQPGRPARSWGRQAGSAPALQRSSVAPRRLQQPRSLRRELMASQTCALLTPRLIAPQTGPAALPSPRHRAHMPRHLRSIPHCFLTLKVRALC